MNPSGTRIYYFANESGQTVGPFQHDELARMAGAGLILPETMVHEEGESSWRPFSSLPENFGTIEGAAPQALPLSFQGETDDPPAGRSGLDSSPIDGLIPGIPDRLMVYVVTAMSTVVPWVWGFTHGDPFHGVGKAIAGFVIGFALSGASVWLADQWRHLDDP